jgi:hypothetical protein
MFEINEIVNDGILSVSFLSINAGNNSRNYTIINNKGEVVMSGKITGLTQRSSFYVGDLKIGTYEFALNESEKLSFKIN